MQSQSNDYTNGQNLFQYLGSFWTQIFSEQETLLGLSESVAANLVQVYSDFANVINNSGITTASPLNSEKTVPLFIYKSGISKSSNSITFGNTTTYGPQDGHLFQVSAGRVLTIGGQFRDSGAFFTKLADNVVHAGSTIVNRLISPSVILVKGIDYVVDNGDLIFIKNPFDNPLIASKKVALSNGAVDDLIVLWLSESLVNKNNIHNSGGYLFYKAEPKEVDPLIYASAIKALFGASSGGASLKAIDSLIAALSSLPVIVEAKEKVESIFDFNGDKIVVTDMGVYKIQSIHKLRSNVVVGSVLSAGTPLTTSSSVEDSFSNPEWWTQIPLILVGENLTVSANIGGSIGFVNKLVNVDVLQNKTTTANGNVPLARFEIIGNSRIVKNFWDEVDKRSIEKLDFLSNRLWKAANFLLIDESPDFSKQVWINPLQLLVEEICPGAILCIKILSMSQSIALTSAMSQLNMILPAYSTVVTFLDYTCDDELSFNFPDSISPQTDINIDSMDSQFSMTDELGLVGTNEAWGYISENGKLQTPIAESISLSYSPEMTIDSLDLTSSILEDIKITNLKVCT